MSLEGVGENSTDVGATRHVAYTSNCCILKKRKKRIIYLVRSTIMANTTACSVHAITGGGGMGRGIQEIREGRGGSLANVVASPRVQNTNLNHHWLAMRNAM